MTRRRRPSARLEDGASPRPSDDDIHGKPGHLIRRLQQIAVAIFVAETEGFDVTPVQYAALLAIRIHPGIDQTTLVNVIAFDRSTIGAVVERLEAKKLIQRAAGAEDRRTKLLFITPQGRKLLADAATAVEAAQRTILAPLNQQERTAFMRILTKLVDSNNDHSRAPLRLPAEAENPRSAPRARAAGSAGGR
jgi:MarR family transcriptional regulator, lower aerobic nicotinate degradation pathway regulator